jgi:cysteine-rich repeat protein
MFGRDMARTDDPSCLISWALMTRLSCLMTWLVAAIACSGCVITGETDPVCGDGQKSATEECDDGDLQDGDGCTSTCTLEPYCGDAVQAADEECDDGNNAGGDGCSAGCVIEPFCGDGARDPGEDCDDGAHVPSDGCSPECKTELRHATTASWSFHLVAAPTTDLVCPVGFGTVAVHSQALDDADAPIGPAIVDMFSCSAMTGTIAPVFEGRYRTFLAVTNANGTQTYATTESRIVDLRATNMDYTAAIFEDGGYFKLAWNLVGAMTYTALTCQSTPIAGISLLSTDVASPTTFFDDVFMCQDGEGLTAALPEGTYTVSVSAIDGDDAAVGTAPALTNRVIQAPNKVTDLGMVTIPIDGL